MTAALARQKTESAGASRGQEDSRSEMPNAADAVTVLIRLPDLCEPASKETTPVVATGSVQPDDVATVESESTVQPPVAEEHGDQASDAAAALADEEPDARPTEEEPTDTEAATWSAVSVPRPVIQLAGVLALIVMSFGAYYAIVGGGGAVDEGNGEIAGTQGSAEWVEPAPSTESPEPIDIAAAPSLESDQQQQDLFVNSPTADADPNLPNLDITPELEDGTETLAMEAEPSLTLDPQFEEKTDLADSFPGNDPGMQNDRLGSFGFDPGRGQEEQKKTDAFTQPEDRPDAVAPGLEMPQLDQTVDASPQRYPVTDPSTYQYPENYHTMFQASPDTRNSQGASPGPSERSTYEQYPGTARLGPPIEPPPVRR